MTPPSLIVVVDDDPDIRIVVEQMLDYSGYSVKTAANARDALAMGAQEPVGVFIIDAFMPEKSGLALLRDLKIRENPYEVIIMTGSGDFECYLLAQQAGVFGYLHKPFSGKDLVDCVSRALAAVERKCEKLAAKGLPADKSAVSAGT